MILGPHLRRAVTQVNSMCDWFRTLTLLRLFLHFFLRKLWGFVCDFKLILIATLPMQYFPKLMKYICPLLNQLGKARWFVFF